LWGNAEGVRDAVEEGEHGGDVNSFGDLVFFPACDAQLLDIFRSGAVGSFGDEVNVIEQGALRPGEARLLQLTL
jgi:hypothetical protein